MGKYIALLVLTLAADTAAASSCLMPSVHQDFAGSDVVVAAEARDVSITPHPSQSGKYRQTVLWRVHEAWKGSHSYGKNFTTRTVINCATCAPYKLRRGRLMVLYLGGSEPYAVGWCSRTNFL